LTQVAEGREKMDRTLQQIKRPYLTQLYKHLKKRVKKRENLSPSFCVADGNVRIYVVCFE